ncbi:cyclic lactone autoinducer peptide [Natroniella sulfidigena]|nr:cyclic lactone autoinducer peptide [Natroniella sulfidigena]MCK8817405.1 cyclic lactone autoinducer peptide [Natroniella sulfidigena]
MKAKKVVAELLKKAAKANVASASGLSLYQPEVPQSLKEDK